MGAQEQNSEDNSNQKLAVANVKSVLLYALAFVFAMGVNDVMISAFNPKERKQVWGK